LSSDNISKINYYIYIGYNQISARIHTAFQKVADVKGLANLVNFSSELGKVGLDHKLQFKCAAPRLFFDRHLKVDIYIYRYMYVYICIYVCVCIYIDTYIYIHRNML
jgi:hypothetical protein